MDEPTTYFHVQPVHVHNPSFVVGGFRCYCSSSLRQMLPISRSRRKHVTSAVPQIDGTFCTEKRYTLVSGAWLSGSN